MFSLLLCLNLADDRSFCLTRSFVVCVYQQVYAMQSIKNHLPKVIVKGIPTVGRAVISELEKSTLVVVVVCLLVDVETSEITFFCLFSAC